MNSKLSVALLVIACTGCGAHPHNANYSRYVATQSAPYAESASGGPQDDPMDAVLIEQACYSISECRTTAHGLGV